MFKIHLLMAVPTQRNYATCQSHIYSYCVTNYSVHISSLVHIWCYDGFEAMTEAKQKLDVDEEWITLRKSRSKLLNSRSNQVLMAFTYWQPQFDQLSSKLLELRSYTLKVSPLTNNCYYFKCMGFIWWSCH